MAYSTPVRVYTINGYSLPERPQSPRESWKSRYLDGPAARSSRRHRAGIRDRMSEKRRMGSVEVLKHRNEVAVRDGIPASRSTPALPDTLIAGSRRIDLLIR